MSINEEIKATNNKLEQNKAQHNLDRQTAKISALSSENVTQYEFVTRKDAFPEKNLEKAAPIKKFEYYSLEIKAPASASEKQCQKLDKVVESNKKEEKILKSCQVKSCPQYRFYFLQIPQH